MKSSYQCGFKFVELLIVIVIIAILAAISLVTYNGVQARARNAKIRSDLAFIKKAIIAARTKSGKTLSDLVGGADMRYG